MVWGRALPWAVVLCLILGCRNDDEIKFACSDDEDCLVTGCNDEICAAEEVITLCPWKEEYACYHRPYTGCLCQAGTCDWERTAALAACLESPPCTPGETRPADDGCNTCTCQDDLTFLCTDRDCSRCNPGDIKPVGDGCNNCFCRHEGLWECTEKPCYPPVECANGKPCVITGCSGQICAPNEIITECQWRAEFACYREPTTTCTCQTGQCRWMDTPALRECLSLIPP